MAFNRDSIIYSSLRSLCKGFFWIVGLFLAVVFVSTFAAALITSSTSTVTVEQTTTQKILPNAEGVRISSSTVPVILQINIDGIIGAEDLTTEKIRTQLMESREGDFKNDRVKGVLLHINSPGGTVVDADGIYRAIKQYKERYKVPVIAFSEGLCASGGMYVACAADKIYSTDTSIIGSVGVLFPTFLNFSQLLDKIGVQSLTVATGKGKDELNPLRPWQPGEDASIRAISDYIYQYFVTIVTTNRPKMSREKLINEYGAHIFPAVQALEYGYIDGVHNNTSDVMNLLVKDAGIEGQSYQVIELETKSFLYQLLKSESPIFSGKITHDINVITDLDKALYGKFLYMYRPESSH